MPKTIRCSFRPSSLLANVYQVLRQSQAYSGGSQRSSVQLHSAPFHPTPLWLLEMSCHLRSLRQRIRLRLTRRCRRLQLRKDGTRTESPNEERGVVLKGSSCWKSANAQVLSTTRCSPSTRCPPRPQSNLRTTDTPCQTASTTLTSGRRKSLTETNLFRRFHCHPHKALAVLTNTSKCKYVIAQYSLTLSLPSGISLRSQHTKRFKSPSFPPLQKQRKHR